MTASSSALGEDVSRRCQPRVRLLTNVNTHYRDGLYRELQRRFDMDFIFYSDGNEWYWRRRSFPVEHLKAKTLRGAWVGRTRVTPGLIPAVLLKRPEVLIVSGNGKFALAASFLTARVARIPVVLWWGVWQRPPGWRGAVRGWIESFLFRHARAVLTYGNHVSEYVVSRGVPNDAVIPAAQAIDVQQFSRTVDDSELQALRSRLNLPPDAPVIGFAGRLEQEKGVLTLIDSFAQIDLGGSHYLVAVGEGSLANQLRDRARALGISDRVILPGRFPNDQMPVFLAMCDIFVVPSEASVKWTEPWGLVVNEALAAGVCTVTSNSVGATCHGLIRHGETGAVFPAGDAAALSHIFRTLLQNSDLCEQLALAGKCEVAEYNYGAMAEAFGLAIERAVTPIR